MQEAAPRELLVFHLDEEEYGIDVFQVREIRGYERVVPVPGVPAHVKGVTRLRGLSVPIVDLRVRFGRRMPHYDVLTVVVILQLGARIVGMVVDGVADVLTLRDGEIQPAPEDLRSVPGEPFLLEVATRGERSILLVDLEKVLALPDAALLENAFPA